MFFADDAEREALSRQAPGVAPSWFSDPNEVARANMDQRVIETMQLAEAARIARDTQIKRALAWGAAGLVGLFMLKKVWR